jgi:N-acyl-D-amino-acid deacylase
MNAEIAIRGGLVVDGSGGPPVRADVGIANGRFVGLGPRVTAPTELDGSGAIVCPGFIDIHTHYDPQVLWDPFLTPSSWHGVTTVVAGNCGYSIAPTKQAERSTLIRTLDKVEDMRVATLEAGVRWEFETYAEYLEVIARRGTGINFGGYVGHTPVRLYVMGEAAYERRATAEELAAMAAVVRSSVLGGALGFATDRAGGHLADGGRPVPSTVSGLDEVQTLMGELGRLDQGIVSIAAGEDYEWLYDFQPGLGRPISWNSILTFPGETKGRRPYGEKLDYHRRRWEEGCVDVHPQVTCRPIVTEFSVQEPTPFYRVPAFAELVAAPPPDRVGVYANESWRVKAGAEVASTQYVPARWEHFQVISSPERPDWEGRTVASIAEQWKMAEFDVVCAMAVRDNLRTRFEVSWANDEVDGVTRLLQGEGCIIGLSDAGAHVSQMCDAVLPTDFLANWVRDRQVMSVEQGVRKLTGELGDVLCIDRGRIEMGAPADVLVIDLGELDPGPMRRVRDMPAEGERVIADQPRGYRHILVNGVATVSDGKSVVETLPELPGVVVRSVKGQVPRSD